MMSLLVKGFGVLFDSTMLFYNQSNSAVNKAYNRANMLLRCFFTRDCVLQIKLFDKFVRTILEYNSPFCSSHIVKDISAIECVQKVFHQEVKRTYKCLFYAD